MSADDSQPQEDAVQVQSESVQVSIPKSFFGSKGGLAGLLTLVLGGAAAAGAGSGYITGGLSAEQRLEVVTEVHGVRDEIREDIEEVSDDIRDVSDQVSSVESEVAYIRGKLGLVESGMRDDRLMSVEPEPEP